VRVRGTNESALIPVFERIEAAFPGVRSFSLPSVDHPTLGPHIEIGVKGADSASRSTWPWPRCAKARRPPARPKSIPS
jgi:hypothetical protein